MNATPNMTRNTLGKSDSRNYVDNPI